MHRQNLHVSSSVQGIEIAQRYSGVNNAVIYAGMGCYFRVERSFVKFTHTSENLIAAVTKASYDSHGP